MRRKRMHGRRRRKSPLKQLQVQKGQGMKFQEMLGLFGGGAGDGEKATNVNADEAKEAVAVDESSNKGDLDHTHKGDGSKKTGLKEKDAAESSASNAAKAMGGGGQNDGAWGRRTGGW